MASKIKVDQIEGSAGSSITIPSGQTLTVTDGLAGFYYCKWNISRR
jgi:uncharacterized protein YodC (DUF2158 family)